jgi:hypothetical protein
MNTWRKISQRTIARVEAQCAGKSIAEFRKALRDAYPFGERAHFPYKVWCSEQKLALARFGKPEYVPGKQDDLLQHAITARNTGEE